MIRFSKYIWLYALISLLVLVPGMYALARYGLRPAVDFTGGTLIEVRAPTGVSSFIRLKPGEAEAAHIDGEIVRSETVGPVLGKELLHKAIAAALFAIGAILLYVAYAFRNIKFGVSAIIALMHDLFVVVGVF